MIDQHACLASRVAVAACWQRCGRSTWVGGEESRSSRHPLWNGWPSALPVWPPAGLPSPARSARSARPSAVAGCEQPTRCHPPPSSRSTDLRIAPLSGGTGPSPCPSENLSPRVRITLGLGGLRGVHRCRQPSARVGGSSARSVWSQSPRGPGWSQPMPALARLPGWSLWVEGDHRGPPARGLPGPGGRRARRVACTFAGGRHQGVTWPTHSRSCSPPRRPLRSPNGSTIAMASRGTAKPPSTPSHPG